MARILRKDFDYSKLRGRIVEKFGTTDSFAENIEVSAETLSKKLNNRIGITREDMILWSTALDIPLEEYGAFYFVEKLNEV